MKYLKRTLGLPFFIMLNVIGMVFLLFKLSRAFILYGGEACAYTEKNQQKTIADIYYQLEKNPQYCTLNNIKQTEPELVPFHSICTSCKNGGMCGCTVANTMVRKI
jgi:hypothetical protein